MMRCCEGETYVRANDPGPQPSGFDVALIGWSHRDTRVPTRQPAESWAVCCFDCDAVLAVVDGVPREEVYALV